MHRHPCEGARDVKLGRTPRRSPQQVAYARTLLDQREHPVHVARQRAAPR
jgi:hypothetical protein